MFSYSSQFYPDALFSHTKSTLLNISFIILWSLIHLQVRNAVFSWAAFHTCLEKEKDWSDFVVQSEISEDAFLETDSTE